MTVSMIRFTSSEGIDLSRLDLAVKSALPDFFVPDDFLATCKSKSNKFSKEKTTSIQNIETLERS